MNPKLSDLIDGQTGDLPTDAEAVDWLLSDAEAQAQWQRMHMVRAVLQGEHVTPVNAKDTLADKVAAALEEEPAVLAPNNLQAVDAGNENIDRGTVIALKGGDGTGFGAKAALWAVAASFFAVVLFNTNPFSQQANGPAAGLASNAAKTDTQAFDAAEQELQALVVAHGEFASLAGLNGLAAYARIVNADAAE